MYCLHDAFFTCTLGYIGRIHFDLSICFECFDTTLTFRMKSKHKHSFVRLYINLEEDIEITVKQNNYIFLVAEYRFH